MEEVADQDVGAAGDGVESSCNPAVKTKGKTKDEVRAAVEAPAASCNMALTVDASTGAARAALGGDPKPNPYSAIYSSVVKEFFPAAMTSKTPKVLTIQPQVCGGC